MPKESFLENRIKSVGFALRGAFLLIGFSISIVFNRFYFALRGAFLLIRTEASIKIQVFLAILMTVAGFYFEISNTEWILQVLAISLVVGIEGTNTAIEKLCDFIHPEFDKRIGFIKDVSAGAVMLVSIGAIIVGLIIYLPKIF
ncbi:MAG TPA: diacylglycerol kinase family protein [Pricia sp.]|nr:diacylglycerol kinase family protein [Pricia sp.]